MEQEAANRVPLDDDVVAGSSAVKKGELEGCPEGVLFARELGHGRRPRSPLFVLPSMAVLVIGAITLAVILNIVGCLAHAAAPDEVGPGYCTLISRQMKRKYDGPWQVVLSSFAFDLVIIVVVIGIIWSLTWEWIDRYGVPFSLALKISGDQFSGEKAILRKEVRLKNNLILQLAEEQVPHGHGVYTFAEGHALSGSWQRGHLCGHGEFQHSGGDLYVGEFEEGQPSGQGKYTWVDGTVYEGHFAKGLPHGRGVKTWLDGDRYEGEWVRGKPGGFGVYNWTSGRSYEGQWREGKMEGKGKCTFVNGDSYEGGWREDRKSGAGVYTWADGTSHEGEW